MRKTLIVITALVIAPILFAQTTIHDEIALTRAEIQANRQAIVAASLGLSDAQAKTFWPLYREYRQKLEPTSDRAWNLFTTYGQVWNTMNNDDATKALNEWLSIEKDIVSVKQKYAKRFAKELGGVTAARFFQIDNKLDTIIRLEAAHEIPLVSAK